MDSLLPLPPPYRAWLTISSDPDHTEPSDWSALHQFIWEDLGLPIADSIFLRNANSTLPSQVSVESHPEILTAHPIDTLHTWGDYILAETETFRREVAEEAVEFLERVGLEPRVWIDHSFFHGNLVKAPRLGGLPEIRDASGIVYPNQFYTLDLAHRAGIRYVWDGTIRRAFAHPDRPVSRAAYYGARNGNPLMGRVLAALDRLGRPLWNWSAAEKFDYEPRKNRIYYPLRFPDGRSLYCFWRYGSWDLADIRGLGELLRADQIEGMMDDGAACIVYTHLGKRNVRDLQNGAHLPDATRAALEALRERMEAQELMVSSVAKLLDYCVLRDHATVQDGRVDFRADGIRFERLTPLDLEGHCFGLKRSGAFRPDRLEVSCDGEPVEFKLREETSDALALEILGGKVLQDVELVTRSREA